MNHNIHIIQDIPTPHNNYLINNIRGYFFVKESYCEIENRSRYNWKEPISEVDQVGYGIKLNFNFIKTVFLDRSSSVVLVGIMNVNTKVLLLMFFLLQRQFYYWTDLPDSRLESFHKRTKRRLTNFVLRFSNVRMLCVGNVCVNYYLERGFCQSTLTNFPIFVEVSKSPKSEKFLEEKLSVFAGSRLIKDKGFDLLISAIAKIPDKSRRLLAVEIVGDGPEYSSLKEQALALGVDDVINFLGWLSPAEYNMRMSQSQVVVQPSRQDAFGISVYGMAHMCACVTTYSSGSGKERINDGFNGFIYSALDTVCLANILVGFINDRDMTRNIAIEGYRTALEWDGSRALKILKEMC